LAFAQITLLFGIIKYRQILFALGQINKSMALVKLNYIEGLPVLRMFSETAIKMYHSGE
jgi:hypothetical protein